MKPTMKETQSEQFHLWHTGRARWCLVAALLALFLALVMVMGGMGSGAVMAQSEAPAASPAASEITPDQVNAVAREIWCPLCSGVRLDACELKACQQMKEVIAIKLAEGEDTASIKAYFVEQYGPQVMGEPPRSGFNWLAWILPAVAVVVGGYFFWRTTQRMVQPTLPLDAEMPPPPSTATADSSTEEASLAAQVEAAEKLEDADEYTQKLEEELAKYG